MDQNDKIGYRPIIVLNIWNLQKIPLIELELNNEKGSYETVRKQLKKICNYGWDNGILAISDGFGEVYTMSVFKSKQEFWDISFWNGRGQTSVINVHYPYESDEDKINDDTFYLIKKALEDYTQGIKICSDPDCNNRMPNSWRMVFSTDRHDEQYGGQYFAGMYCKACWERKWKAIEAKETYN